MNSKPLRRTPGGIPRFKPALPALPIVTEWDAKLLATYDTSQRISGLFEIAVIRHLCTDLLTSSMQIAVACEGVNVIGPSATMENVMDAVFVYSEGSRIELCVHCAPFAQALGVIAIRLGDGAEIITDYSMTLTDALAATEAYAKQLSEWL